MADYISDSELIINPDGSIYHLNLKPDEIANDIITVGDPDRVDAVAQRLDKIYLTKHKREFKTITGSTGGKDVTIISTGIGTDNIDIVFTELDALVNVDLKSRIKKSDHTSLNFYRIGTSGAIREEIEVDQYVISRYAIGLESLMHYYDWDASDQNCKEITELAVRSISSNIPNIVPYVAASSEILSKRYASLGILGITVTATGFYGPQGRQLIGRPKDQSFIDNLAEIKLGQIQTTNLEMETAGIYGMASLLGHQAISLNAILANRVSKTFSKNPQKTVDLLIDRFFELFTS